MWFRRSSVFHVGVAVVVFFESTQNSIATAPTATWGSSRKPPSRSPSPSRFSSPRSPSSKAASARRKDTAQSNVTSVVQIIETEVRVNHTWSSPPFESLTRKNESDETDERLHHWMDALTLQPTDSPFTYQLDRNQAWVGEWKILVPQKSQQSSSSHGWHYTRDERYSDGSGTETDQSNSKASRGKRSTSPLLQYTHRQRVWVRTVSTTLTSTTDQTKHVGVLTKTSSKTKRNRKRRANVIVKMMQAIRDDWNFKGLGCTLTKSLIFPNAYGIALRLPLTLNFATWERHSSWPSIGTSMAIFYSGSPAPGAVAAMAPNYQHHYFTLALFLHVSLRVEYVKAIANYVGSIAVPTIVAGLIRILLNGWILAVSALLYPLTRRMPLVVVTPPPIDTNAAATASTTIDASEWSRLWTWPEPPRNRRDSEERLSVNWCWRWTPMLPPEFRTFYGHYFAVQIATLWEAIVIPWLGTIMSVVSKMMVSNSNPLSLSVPNWIARHTAAIGLSLSGPLRPSETGGILVTATSIASLSGFYVPIASWFAIRPKKETPSTILPHDNLVQCSNETSSLLLENVTPSSNLAVKQTERSDPRLSTKSYPTKAVAT